MATKEKPAFLSEQYAEQAIKRWDPLLDGIKGDYARAALATLLDNQQEYMENQGYTTSSDVQVFTTLAFPLIRRIYTGLYANQLVSIQPMRQPTGKIFFLDFLYGSDLDPVRRGNRMDFQDKTLSADDARFYTKGQARGQVLNVTDDDDIYEVDHNLTPWLETNFTPLRVNANLKLYVDSIEQTLVFTGSPASGTSVRCYPEIGRFEFHADDTPGGATVTADFDVRLEGDDSRIPEITMAMSSDAIAAETRKLKYRWTIESDQDMRAYHGLSVEDELATHAASEILREIDREIINDLLGAASANVNWAKAYDPSSGQAGEGYTRKEYNETVVHAMMEADKAIFDKRLVRPNWAVTGTDVALHLMKLDTFRPSGSFDGNMVVTGGPNVVGSVAGRYTLIVDPLFQADTVLLGYKGETFAQTGYVYAPYTPLMITPTFMDPNDFTPRRGMMRRDATKVVSNDFYATVTLV